MDVLPAPMNLLLTAMYILLLMKSPSRDSISEDGAVRRFGRIRLTYSAIVVAPIITLCI